MGSMTTGIACGHDLFFTASKALKIRFESFVSRYDALYKRRSGQYESEVKLQDIFFFKFFVAYNFNAVLPKKLGCDAFAWNQCPAECSVVYEVTAAGWAFFF